MVRSIFLLTVLPYFDLINQCIVRFPGVLTVNYSSRLVQLLREVRQLSELGVAVPSKIKKAAEEGERYYRFGVLLKKVANFFNNMDARILKTQRPMLLTALVAFEDLVEKRNGRGAAIEWTTPTECEHYVERLQHAHRVLQTPD